VAKSDRVELQMLLLEHSPALNTAQRMLEDLGVESTGRIKTEKSTVEKLRRQSTRLSQVQDLAGLRIVATGTELEQDELASEIAERLQIVDRDDRRKEPQFGYRALHLIADVDGSLVEIQVRTRLQHAWAEAFEKLADATGRGIRYGAQPDSEQAARVIELMMRISAASSRLEAQQRSIAETVRDIASLESELRAKARPRNRSKRRRQEAEVRRAGVATTRLRNVSRGLHVMEDEILGLLGQAESFL
jgi:ppGpp synthetase/RelA/SpoT-type nucleotidyltranferase